MRGMKRRWITFKTTHGSLAREIGADSLKWILGELIIRYFRLNCLLSFVLTETSTVERFLVKKAFLRCFPKLINDYN